MQNRKNALIRTILEDIEVGRLNIGDALPSRNQLVKKYNLSYDTVDKALKTLISSGHLNARQGSGTFVANRSGTRNNKISKLYVIYHSSGYFTENLGSIFAAELDNPKAMMHIHDRETELHLAELLRPGTGVIWYYPFARRLTILETLRHANVPQLLLNRDYDGFNFITTDPEQSLYEGLQWLTSQAGRELSLIYCTPSINAPYRSGRIIAAYKNINRLGAHVAPDNIYEVPTNNFAEEISSIANRLFLKSNITKGIVLLDVEMAMLLISCGLSLGKQPGRDYYLLVFDYEKQLAHFHGIGMMSQMLQSFGHEAKNYFFNPALDRSKPFRKYISAELITT